MLFPFCLQFPPYRRRCLPPLLFELQNPTGSSLEPVLEPEPPPLHPEPLPLHALALVEPLLVEEPLHLLLLDQPVEHPEGPGRVARLLRAAVPALEEDGPTRDGLGVHVLCWGAAAGRHARLEGVVVVGVVEELLEVQRGVDVVGV